MALLGEAVPRMLLGSALDVELQTSQFSLYCVAPIGAAKNSSRCPTTLEIWVKQSIGKVAMHTAHKLGTN